MPTKAKKPAKPRLPYDQVEASLDISRVLGQFQALRFMEHYLANYMANVYLEAEDQSDAIAAELRDAILFVRSRITNRRNQLTRLISQRQAKYPNAALEISSRNRNDAGDLARGVL
jgi:hypothetical protein